MPTTALKRPRPRNRDLSGFSCAESETRPLAELRPSPENDRLYRPVDPNDPEVRELAASIRRHGLMEPVVVTLDGYILSGHRRFCAAGLAGLETVPVRAEPIRRAGDVDAFVVLLREHNRQRDKSSDEKLREELVTADPEEAYVALLAHRKERSQVSAGAMDLGAVRCQHRISVAKRPFAEAVAALIRGSEAYWPLSDRRVHYLLLNAPPLRHAAKPASRYRNDAPSYKDLTDLLTRLRLAGEVPMRAIGDETRPVTEWGVHADPRAFVRRELDVMFKGYRRDLQRTQPCHVEVLCEKNIARPIIEPVAGRYGVPVTTGRGYCSLPPRAAMAERFRRSGKDRLVLLAMSDCDPEGFDIAESYARSMRDDLGVESVHAVKVGLTPEQARSFNLPEDTTAKLSSSRAAGYVEQHGPHVWELEALPPETMERLLSEAIDGVIDTAAFNAELDTEKQDAAYLDGLRRRVHAEARFALES